MGVEGAGQWLGSAPSFRQLGFRLLPFWLRLVLSMQEASCALVLNFSGASARTKKDLEDILGGWIWTRGWGSFWVRF